MLIQLSVKFSAEVRPNILKHHFYTVGANQHWQVFQSLYRMSAGFNFSKWYASKSGEHWNTNYEHQRTGFTSVFRLTKSCLLEHAESQGTTTHVHLGYSNHTFNIAAVPCRRWVRGAAREIEFETLRKILSRTVHDSKCFLDSKCRNVSVVGIWNVLFITFLSARNGREFSPQNPFSILQF